MIKKLTKHKKQIICLLITALSLVCTFVLFGGAFSIFTNAIKQFALSVYYYLIFLVTLQLPDESLVVTPPPADNEINIIPPTLDDFGKDASSLWQQLFNGENLADYFASLDTFLLGLMRVLMIAIPLYFMLRTIIKRHFVKHNNNYNKDSIALKGFKKTSGKTYTPAKAFITNLINYIKQSQFLRLWLLIWAFNFNLFAIFFSSIATFLYFFITLDFTVVYLFIYNTIVNLMPAFIYIPKTLWLVLALLWFDRLRKNKGYSVLVHNENRNKGFIQALPVCTMLVGSMGKGKTTILTDMALSTEAIFRHKAYELMLDCDLKFPHFPFINLEKEVKHAIKARYIKNLAGCEKYINDIERSFYASLKSCRKRGISARLLPKLLFDYDFEKYGLTYDDKQKLISLFEVLRDYTKLYFVFIMQSSLIVSNYAIRTDFAFADLGNLPMWNLDFFAKDTKYQKVHSRHSHILDFDMFRLGKKVIANNIKANAFEFGVAVITEGGKERGNMLDTKELQDVIKEYKKDKQEVPANQLSDKFNDALKLIRHKGTICNFPFVKVFLDEQRPESLGADARELCNIVHIKDKSPTILSMPFFFVAELIYAFIYPRYTNTYSQFRFYRGDNTLLMHLIKKLGAGFIRYYQRAYNLFGYNAVKLALEAGTLDGTQVDKIYYLSHKKIYANRFSTDAYNDIFATKTRNAKISFDELKEYESHKATLDEFKRQNSYLINRLEQYNK